MRTSRELARRREAGEVDDLVVAGAAAQTLGVGARGAFDEHLDGAPDEALGALARVALDGLEQALHALTLTACGTRPSVSSAAAVPRGGRRGR